MLNQSQRKALEILESGRNVFLSGEAGTGKSFVLNYFLEKNSRKNILMCAPTGIAAINVHGSTLHRVFNVPMEPISPQKNPTKASETVQEADIIVIDEISMCRFDCFEYVAKSIKLAEKQAQEKENKKALSERREPVQVKRKQLIVVGDFFQLPPVITDKDRRVLNNYWEKHMHIGDGFAFQAPMWQEFNFNTVMLDEPMRQQGEIEFVTNLKKMRHGDSSAIEWFNKNSNPKMQKGIYLCATNKIAEQVNLQESEKIKRPSKDYEAVITGQVTETDRVTSSILTLKVGMQVMALINDAEKHYQNGTLGTIKRMHDNFVEVDFGNGSIDIYQNTWEIIDYKIVPTSTGENNVEKIVIGTFKQLPLKIAYAITMHKSQGQTYESANIAPYCFASGQLYVALSRIKSIKKLHLTAEIKKEHLIFSEDVLNFYENEKARPNDTEPLPSVTKSSHGGNRAGAGRKKKYGTATCTIRIPVSAKEAVMEFINSQKWE